MVMGPPIHTSEPLFVLAPRQNMIIFVIYSMRRIVRILESAHGKKQSRHARVRTKNEKPHSRIARICKQVRMICKCDSQRNAICTACKQVSDPCKHWDPILAMRFISKKICVEKKHFSSRWIFRTFFFYQHSERVSRLCPKH